MISCREVFDFLVDYVSGELPPHVRAEFERHLAVCPPCVAYLNSYRDTIRLGRAACRDNDVPPPEIPEELVKAVMATMRGECSNSKSPPSGESQ
ncbi:MAG: zf-HC2 domain-containing protein [Phycisphaerae bacterium]|nr:zf-HC2 domain-containing protein [Phycisphaerae bacterium]NUQ48169.1 zf-HC2 domain-containing protein [Phycisphaerae bacterium]